ncbi:hypothetical protein Bbelb_341570 [Branchiostoma belcheri]|nr:hypothetical protein Bbelb_341570 [Branchiostoma belcheri]
MTEGPDICACVGCYWLCYMVQTLITRLISLSQLGILTIGERVSRDKHQVPREIPREFAGYHAGVCGISRGSLRDLLREFAGSPAGFIGISRGTKSSPATPIFGGMQTPSVGPGVPTPRRHRNRTSPAAALADSPAPPDHVAFWRANHSAQMGTRPPAGPRIQRVESDAPPQRNTA